MKTTLAIALAGATVAAVLVSGATPQPGLPAEARRILEVLLGELPLKQAVQLATQISGAGRNELYQLALQIKNPE